MPSPEPGIKYRRNGKQQACEPCRKGKLACDHKAPHCGRCLRRKMTDRCIYHPAPMTRNRAPGPPEVLEPVAQTGSALMKNYHVSTTSAEVGSSQFDSQPRSIVQDNSDGSQPFDTRSSSYLDSQHLYGHTDNSQADWKNAEYQRSARYYGPTSFAAVFSEPQAEFNERLLDIGDDLRKHPGTWIFGQPLLGRQRPNTPSVRKMHVVKVLWNIPPRVTCNKLMNSFMSMHDSTLDPTMINHCISTLWSTFATELDAPRNDRLLAIVSDALFNNEETPLPPSPVDGIKWLNTFTGTNIRFEMLGILFCFFGLSFQFLQDWDPLFDAPENEGRDRIQTAWRMKECAEICLNMCHAAETVNFLVTSLIFNLKILESACTGDETYKIRRLHGDMITSGISAGLHRLPVYGTSNLSAASEYKRRLFAALYCSDKIHASLNGTPPLLRRWYGDIEPPLDLDLNACFLPPDELASAINSLDVNGWNTAGKLYQTTLLRAKVHLTTIREEILELALGVNINITVDQIVDIHYRSQEMWDAFPSQLHYCDEKNVPKECDAAVLYERAYLMLQHLQSKLLLDRVAIARGFANGQGLLETAMEILDLCLMFWVKRDELLAFSSGFDWIITYYGVPAAGVTCMELLKKFSKQSTVEFSMSDAVQKLTLFVGFLEWIRPTFGNFKLAGRLRNVIKRVLDHVLEQPRRKSVVFEGGNEMAFDPMLSIAPFDEIDDLDWLNTIDWTQGSWIDGN